MNKVDAGPHADGARVVGYHPEYAADFARLNYQWIETYFAVEPEDRLALDNPQAYAIDRGGEIFFVLTGAQVVGTVALLRESEGVFELAKMAVDPEHQGRGYSRLLMDACLAFARERGAEELRLVTNTVLGPALGLYEAVGFVSTGTYQDQRYARGNLEMRLRL